MPKLLKWTGRGRKNRGGKLKKKSQARRDAGKEQYPRPLGNMPDFRDNAISKVHANTEEGDEKAWRSLWRIELYSRAVQKFRRVYTRSPRPSDCGERVNWTRRACWDGTTMVGGLFKEKDGCWGRKPRSQEIQLNR